MLISRHPPAFVAVVSSERIFQFHPSENRFSHHAEVERLLTRSYNAYRELRFPRLIELCGTAEALEALVDSHFEDDLPLYVLCFRKSWNKVLARITQLPTQAAVAELFSQDEGGGNAFALVCAYAAHVEVLERMFNAAELNAEKRNTLDIADDGRRLPLHYTGCGLPDPAVIKFLVRHHPSSRSPRTRRGGPRLRLRLLPTLLSSCSRA